MSVLDMTQNNSSNAGVLENAEYHFIAIAPKSTLAQQPDRVLSMG